ncbi:MAG: hypothetical protein WCI80_05845 [Bacteroidota bacterium]
MAYTYFLRNKITNQFYYGSRDSSHENDLWIKYFSSSTYVKNLIELFGVESFESKVIFVNSDYDVCYWYEQLLIRDTIKNKLSLNKYYLDPDTSIKKFCTLGPKTKSTKIKMREAKKRYFSDEDNKKKHRERIQKLHKDGKCLYERTVEIKQSASKKTTEIMLNQTVRQKLRDSRLQLLTKNPQLKEELSTKFTKLNKLRIGVSLSKEHKEKISKSCKNRETPSEETRQRLSNALKGKLKSESAKEAFRQGWKKRKASGKDNNNPFKERITCPHCGLTGQTTNMKRWHFNNCKKLIFLMQ